MTMTTIFEVDITQADIDRIESLKKVIGWSDDDPKWEAERAYQLCKTAIPRAERGLNAPWRDIEMIGGWRDSIPAPTKIQFIKRGENAPHS